MKKIQLPVFANWPFARLRLMLKRLVESARRNLHYGRHQLLDLAINSVLNISSETGEIIPKPVDCCSSSEFCWPAHDRWPGTRFYTWAGSSEGLACHRSELRRDTEAKINKCLGGDFVSAFATQLRPLEELAVFLTLGSRLRGAGSQTRPFDTSHANGRREMRYRGKRRWDAATRSIE